MKPVGIRELALARLATGGPDLGGEERLPLAGLMSARMSPTRSSELPYMGELSITRPPACQEAAHGRAGGIEIRSTGRNVEHLPGAEAERR